MTELKEDWKGRALRAERAMDIAARIVTQVMSGECVKESDWAVQEYLKAVEDYKMFRYGYK